MKTIPDRVTPASPPTTGKPEPRHIRRRAALWLRHLKQRLTGEDLVAELHDLSTDPEFVASTHRARAEVKATGGLSTAELRRELDLDPPVQK